MVCDLPTCRQGSSDQRDARHIAPAIRCTVPVATPRNSESVALWQLLSSRCWPTLVRHRARQRENKVAGNDDKRPVSAPPPAYAQHKVTMDFSTREARIRPMLLRRSAKAGRTSNQRSSHEAASFDPCRGSRQEDTRRYVDRFSPTGFASEDRTSRCDPYNALSCRSCFWTRRHTAAEF